MGSIWDDNEKPQRTLNQLALAQFWEQSHEVGQGIYCSKLKKTHHILGGEAKSVGQQLWFLQDHHFDHHFLQIYFYCSKMKTRNNLPAVPIN